MKTLVAALLVCFSCFGQEPPKDEKVRVYVYRYKQFVGSALEPSVFADDTQLARMDNGRFFIVEVSPGAHTFRANDKQSGIALDAKAGTTYYIRVEVVAGFMKGHGRLVLTQPEQGQFEIGKLEYLGKDKIKDSRVLPNSLPPAKPAT